MPFPLTHSFALDAGDVEPGRILDHVQEAAKAARMDLVERGPAHVVLSSSFMKAGQEDSLPMLTATRFELRVEGPAGRRRVLARARFGECVFLGAVLVVAPWIAALILSPANAMFSLRIALPCLLGIWLLLYLYGMLDVRVWTRVRVEELAAR